MKAKHLFYCFVVIIIGWSSWQLGLQEKVMKVGQYLIEPGGMGLRSYLLSFGQWGPSVVVGLLIFQAVIPPLPASVIILAAMWIYGPVWGFVYSFIGGQLGAMITYWIGGWLGRAFIAKWLGERQLAWVEDMFLKYGLYAVLFARLTPILSVDAISYGAGASGMPFGRFCFAVAAGQTPALLAFAILGKKADNLLELLTYCMVGGIVLAVGFYLWKKRTILQGEVIE